MGSEPDLSFQTVSDDTRDQLDRLRRQLEEGDDQPPISDSSREIVHDAITHLGLVLELIAEGSEPGVPKLFERTDRPARAEGSE